MKTLNLLLFSVALAISTNSIQAQTKKIDFTSQKHEISVIVDDIFERNSIVQITPIYYENYYYFPEYTINEYAKGPEIGIGYKLNYTSFGLRSKLKFSNKNSEYSDANNDNIGHSQTYISAVGMLGIELHKNFSRSQLFYGLDGFYNYKKIHYEEKENTYYNGESTAKLNAAGFSPFIGLKYYITEHLSLSTEIKAIAEFYKLKNEYESRDYYYDPLSSYWGIIERETEEKGSNFKIGPLGSLSVNIHF